MTEDKNIYIYIYIYICAYIYLYIYIGTPKLNPGCNTNENPPSKDMPQGVHRDHSAPRSSEQCHDCFHHLCCFSWSSKLPPTARNVPHNSCLSFLSQTPKTRGGGESL